ncbi:hypothetical protein [Ilumatobacter sp.]|uniref:hypothetical protein n=1 Tax=Ilumatobacter sp. TaxID=1967498 RepID=UPI003B51C98D
MTERSDVPHPAERASGPEGGADVPAARSRRAVVTATAGAAVLAVAAARRSSGRAEAADGDELRVGVGNSAESRTILDGPSFVVTDGEELAGSLARRVLADSVVETGVYGFTAGADASRAVWGLDQTADGVGVYGQHGGGGVGTGVFARSANGPGVIAVGTDSDVSMRGSGQIRFVGTREVASTSGGAIGSMVRDASGTLWYCYATDRWQRIAGRSQASTFVAIDPTRVYDSRSPQPIPGALPAGGARVISVRTGRDLTTGGVVEASLVPPDATAVSYNLTAARTIGSGFLTINPGDVAAVRSSAVNWTGDDQVVANSGTVRVDVNGTVRVICGGVASAADLIVDVTGYYS